MSQPTSRRGRTPALWVTRRRPEWCIAGYGRKQASGHNLTPWRYDQSYPTLRPKAGAVNYDHEGPIHNRNTPYLGPRVVQTTGTTSYLYTPGCLTISRMARHLPERELFPRIDKAEATTT